jgi:alpha,alpha-trehalose phosphorylase (configuration-retaining)
VGLALRFYPNKREYALAIHDGMGVVGQEHGTLEGPVPDDIVDRILSRVGEYAQARGHKIALLSVAGPLDPILAPAPPGLEVDVKAPPTFLSRIWLELDTVPFLVQCKDTQFSLAGEAVHAVELALEQLSPTTTTIVKASTSERRREVLGMCLSIVQS